MSKLDSPPHQRDQSKRGVLVETDHRIDEKCRIDGSIHAMHPGAASSDLDHKDGLWGCH